MPTVTKIRVILITPQVIPDGWSAANYIRAKSEFPYSSVDLGVLIGRAMESRLEGLRRRVSNPPQGEIIKVYARQFDTFNLLVALFPDM